MGLEIVPVALLMGFVFFSSTGKAPVTPTSSYLFNPEIVNWEVESPSINEALDNKTIYKYITTSYKKISSSDAKAISSYLVEYGKQHQIDPKFTAALISRESGFNKNAISSSGAKGLGQIKEFNYPSLNITDPYDIKENAAGTTVYVKQMLKNWKDQSSKVSLALASYFKGYTGVKNTPGLLDEPSTNYVKGIKNAYQKILDLQKSIEAEK